MARYMCELMILLGVEVTLIVAAVKDSSAGSRITLNMTEQNITDPTINLRINYPETMEFSLDSNQTVLYSTKNAIYYWDISQGRESSTKFIQRNDGDDDDDVNTIGFYQISSKRLLVRFTNSLYVYQVTDYALNNSTRQDTLACRSHDCCHQFSVRCRQKETLDLGPIAVDHRSSSRVIYYIDGSTLYRVDLSLDSAATTYDFNSIGESATAMTFNKDYSMVTIFSHTGVVITANHFDLVSRNSRLVKFHEYHKPVVKAIIMRDSLLLCHSLDGLLLIDMNRELSSFVFERTTHLPSYNTNNISHDKIKVTAMADMKKQKSLLAFDLHFRVINLEYTVESITDNVSAVSEVPDIPDIPDVLDVPAGSDKKSIEYYALVGCIIALVMLVIGIALAGLIYKIRKRRSRQTAPKPSHRRRRRQRTRTVSDHVLGGIELNTLDQTVVEQGIVRQNQEDEEQSDVGRSNHDSQVKNKPLPPLPIQYRHPGVHMRSNNADMSGEPYHEKVLENPTPRPPIPRPPYVPPRISPLSNSNFPGTHTDGTHTEESPYCDNPCVFPDNDAQYFDYDYAVEPSRLSNLTAEPNQYRQPVMHMRPNDAEVCDEPDYVEVLEHVNRPFNAPRTPYVPPRISPLSSTPLPGDSASTSDEVSGTHTDDLHTEESLYSDNPCVSPDYDAQYVDYAYAVEPNRLPNSVAEPYQYRQPVMHTRPIDADVSDEPYYEEVLQHVNRPINVLRPQYVPPSILPLPSTPLHVVSASSSDEVSGTHSDDLHSEQSSDSDNTCVSPDDDADFVDCNDAEYVDCAHAAEPRTLSNSVAEPSTFTWCSFKSVLSDIVQGLSA